MGHEGEILDQATALPLWGVSWAQHTPLAWLQSTRPAHLVTYKQQLLQEFTGAMYNVMKLCIVIKYRQQLLCESPCLVRHKQQLC